MSRPSRPRPVAAALAAVLALAATAACTAIATAPARLHGSNGAAVGGAIGVTGRTAGVFGAARARPGFPGRVGLDSALGGRLGDPATGSAYANERRVCRTGGAPRGWIAVDYVSGSDECPARARRRGADSAATVAIVVRYDAWPRGTVLEVCADQPVPLTWSYDTEAPAADPGRCPGAARGDRPTTRRIRRVD